MPRTVPIVPILVTYEGLGEDVLFYRWIRERCRVRNLLRQDRVAPITFIDVEEFETLMSYIAQGRSLLGFLNKRKPNRPWYDRRIDQQLSEIEPRIPRLPYVVELFQKLKGEALASVKQREPSAS